MNDKNIILLLKAIMIFGLFLILLSIYLHLFNPRIEEMGVNGIIISAACVAIGMILSLPTKMFITFLLIKRETEQKINESDSETYGN